MLCSLQLDDYRCFKKYRLDGLARVNLLVGKNNCGKTSVLEAIHFLASGGDPEVLNRTAWQRGEIVVTGDDPERRRRSSDPAITHFFRGHELVPDRHFRVRADDGLGKVDVRVVSVADLEEQQSLFPELPAQPRFPDSDTRWQFALRIEGTRHPAAPSRLVVPLTDEGVISPDWLRRYRHSPYLDREGVPPVQFITPDSLEPRSMSDMWDKVIIDGRESEAIDAMRILEPRLSNIFFLSGQIAYRYGARTGILAAFEGTRRRNPLGSYGEGMRRLLALSLSLIQAEGGILLVDEIDTGLHYSIMGDMWRLVTEAAKKADVQVFATTHSFDCVKGLAWLCENYPHVQTEVSLQKIDSNLERAVALDAEEIMMAVDQGMEVR